MKILLKIVKYSALGILILFFLLCTFPPHSGPRRILANKAIQTSRQIGLSLLAYSQNHGGKYPEGKSSTEVFQKLLDEKYVSDPNIFYSPLTDEVKPTTALKPENVSWDMTCCVDASSPDGVPVVFLTGYKITYHANASAVPLHPSDWWSKGLGNSSYRIAVYYKSTSARAMRASPDGTIPNFIPDDFDPKGKIYRQLTPDGELPP